MMLPNDAEILSLLARLDTQTADDLESDVLEFKPWDDPKSAMQVAIEYAGCFANARGGVVIFGVADRTRGRSKTIHGAKGHSLDVWRRGIYDSIRPNLTVEVSELKVPEGTGQLLVVRVPRGPDGPYGTAKGLYQMRVGKNCMPLDPHHFVKAQITTGAVDWSGEVAEGISVGDLDPIEIARARAILQRIRPQSGLLKMNDVGFLAGLEAVRGGRVTHAGMLLFAGEPLLLERCPQHQIHYVHQSGPSKVQRNDFFHEGLLNILENLEQIFSGPINPEHEVSFGLFKIRIAAFPIESVREALLNAITHRDYGNPGEILIRHTPRELVVSSPGGFVGGITLNNILRHEPVSRNRTLANAFVKLGLVEAAGTGRSRIFTQLLGLGKRKPEFESDGVQVVLRIFDGSYDERMARLVANWRRQGRDIDMDALLVLSHLRENAFIDSMSAAHLLQLDRDTARSHLDLFAQPKTGILERKGNTKAATYHLSKGVAKDLLGKAAYTKTRGLNPARYAEMVRQFVSDHGAITPRECRELLGLGDSATAKVETSRYFKKWTANDGFLRREGSPPKTRYSLKIES